MIHPATELRRVDVRIGFGVFATAPIPRGTITWVRDVLDQRFAPAELESMAAPLRAALIKYSYRQLDGSYVLCWDHARFNNHSCRPSCRTVGDFDIAVRDLAAGDELTLEYAVINVPAPLECECREPGCRGVIRADDVDRFGALWDREIGTAANEVALVEQPLSPLFGANAMLTSLLADVRAGRPPALPSCHALVLRPE